MSSPLAKPHKSTVDRALIGAHRKLSHSQRVRIIADTLATGHLKPLQARRCIDVGCGDMTLMRALLHRCPATAWTGVDIHPLPEALQHDSEWSAYRQFDGAHIPFKDGAFDVALLCDVLHHVPPEVRTGLLAECMRVARTVLIKDHFEYGAVSRTMLRAMDFVGNFGYGVSIPDRYFTERTFAELVQHARGRIEWQHIGIDLYGHLPLGATLLRPEWHFVARVGAVR